MNAANMFQVSWSPDLADQAQKDAKLCGKHQPNDEIINSEIIRKSVHVVWSDIIYGWFLTKRFYDAVTNTCSAKCSQFRKIVNADNKQIGCGKAKCRDEVENTDYFTVICHYKSSVDESKQPYLMGATCSSCQDHYGCEDGLCLSRFSRPSDCDDLSETLLNPNSRYPWRKVSTTVPAPTVPAILVDKGGFISNEKFEIGQKYHENDRLHWTISVPGAQAYELTLLDLDLDHDCSDKVIFTDKKSGEELLTLRSCDPTINRIKMTKAPVYVTAEEIFVNMTIEAPKSSRGTGWKMYYEAIFADENNIFTTPAPDLCKLKRPCGVGGVCHALESKDFYCQCNSGFESASDRHSCVDTDECKTGTMTDISEFFPIFYAYPDLYELTLAGALSNLTEEQLLDFSTEPTLKSAATSFSLFNKLNNCRNFCDFTADVALCLMKCVIFDYSTKVLHDNTLVLLPVCTTTCAKVEATSLDDWRTCYQECLTGRLNVQSEMSLSLTKFVDSCLVDTAYSSTEMCSGAGTLTAVLSQDSSVFDDVAISIKCWQKCVDPEEDVPSALCAAKCLGEQRLSIEVYHLASWVMECSRKV